MAPICTGGAKKTYCRNASTPERAKNCTISILNEFKMTSQSIFFVYLLFCLVLSSSHAQSLSARDNVDCTYANSTCSSPSCANLCVNDEFHPLFPSRCHPSYMSLAHSLESYPGRTSSSVRFNGNSSFPVPGDLLARLSGLKDYTIAVYFKEEAPNGTLFELNNNLAIRYTSEQQLELFLPQLAEKNRDTIATYGASLSGQWKSVFFTFQNLAGDELTLLTKFGSETTIDSVTLNPSVQFASTITSITIGEGFNGFLQDFRVYDPKLETSNSQVIIPTEASFLPQCLCRSGYSISQSETECTMMDQSEMRYNMNARSAEFSTDTSTTTMWQSINNDSPVSLVIGLSPSISLSKIFITFSSSLPAKTTLQYYSEHTSAWMDLQYFAEDCMLSFDIGNNEQLKGSTEINCLQYTSNTTLTFLLAGSGSNLRPQPSEDETPFEIYYNASRVQLIMNGFMNSATNFAIQDIEICPNYCLDLERSCTTTCPQTAGMMTDEGSGMSMSDILAPSSTAPATSVPSMSTSSSVEGVQGNSNTLVSVARSTSAEMTEIATVVPFATTSEMLPQTTMNIDIPMTMTFISSTTMATDTTISATPSMQPITDPETTSVTNEPSSSAIERITSSSLAADILFSSFMNPTSANVMTTVVFNSPTTSIRSPQAPSTVTGALTSDFSGGVQTSAFVLPTPMPSTMAFTESSTQVEASSTMGLNQGVTTSLPGPDMVRTTSAIMQESLSVTTSQVISSTSTQAPTVPVSTTRGVTTSQVISSTSTQAPTVPVSTTRGVTTSQAISSTSTQAPTVPVSTTRGVIAVSISASVSSLMEEAVAISSIMPTFTTFKVPATTTSSLVPPVQGVTTTLTTAVQPLATTSMAASVQPERTSSISFGTVATILPSSLFLSSSLVPEISSSSPGPIPTPIGTVEPSMTQNDIIAEPSQSIVFSVTSSSTGSAFTSSSTIPVPTVSSLALESTQTSSPTPTVASLATTSLVDQPITSAPSAISFMPSPTSVVVSPSTTGLGMVGSEATTMVSATQLVSTTSMQTILVSVPPFGASSQSIGQTFSSASTSDVTALTTSSVNPTTTLLALTDTTASPSTTTSPSTTLSSRTASEFLDEVNQTSFDISLTPTPMFLLTSTEASSSPLLSTTEISIPSITTRSSVSSLVETIPTLFLFTPTPQPSIPTVTTAIQTLIRSESSLQTVATLTQLNTFTSSLAQTIPTSQPTSIQATIMPTPTLVALSTSAVTVITSTAEVTSVTITPEPTVSPTSTEAQPNSRMLTSTIEIEASVQTPGTSTIVTSSVSSSTPIVSMTPEGSGDFMGSGDSLSLEPFPETSQIPAVASTPTATQPIITSISPSSSSISVTPSSAPFLSQSFSATSSISGLSAPVETSTVVSVMSTPTAVSSITTPVLSVVTTTITGFFSPTPTPTPAILSAPTLLPPCETPLAPIQVDTEGLGFILDEDVSRVESDEDGLTYSVTFGKFIGQSGQLSSSGTLNAMLGSFSGQSAMYNLDADSIVSLTGFVSNKNVWSDGPGVSIAFQVRNSSFNSNIDAYCEVILTNMRDNSINRTDCHISEPCGTSTVHLNIPDQWFTMTDVTNVTIEIIIQNRTFEFDSITLMPIGPTQISNAAFMIPPKRSLLPGEEFRVPIYASFDRRLAGFSLDCQILGTAAKLMGAESNFTWSLLPRVHPNESNRISLTAFRNYDRTNTNQINFTESLADLIIAILPTNEETIDIQCDTIKLVLINGTDLVEESDIKYVRSLNRDEESSMRGRVHIETRNYAGLFACTNQNEIINTARLTMTMDIVNMNVYGFNVMSNELDLLSNGVTCFSENESTIKVDIDCMFAYFNGSEMYGADEINIKIMSSSLEASGIIPFRVWLPSQQINISLADSTLNAIDTVATCENGLTLYQLSSFAIMTTISTDMNTTTIYVTSLLRPYLTVSNESIAILTEDRYYIEGIDVGVTRVYVSTLDEMYGAEINVTDDTVEAECLDIFAFSAIDITIPDEIIDMGIATITLQQEFDFIGSNLNIVPVIQFSDNSRMLLTEEYDDLEIIVSSESNDALEQSTPSSKSSYEIANLVNDLNISVLWTLDTLQECENITFSSNISFMTSESPETPILIVNATSKYLTAPDDAATYFGIPDFILLEVYLNYNNTFVSNVTSHDNVTFKVHDNSQYLVSLVDHQGQMRRVETIGNIGRNATITVTFVPLNLTTDYVITVKRKELFILTAYKEDDNRATSQLNQIGRSGVYQRARLGATIQFTDGATEEVSNDNMTVDIISNNSEIVNIIEEQILEVNYAGPGFTNISLEATLMNSSIKSNILDITIHSNPVEVISIENITLSSTSAEANEPIYADCTTVLADGTTLTNTFNEDGLPIYPELITFSTTDLEVLSIIEENSGIIEIMKNSFTNVSLTASAAGNVTYTRLFSINLNPSPGEVGLKTTAAQVKTGDVLEISVILNSAQEAVGVYELELAYEPISQLEIMNVIQGDNWKNGTVISTVKSGGVITVGGVLNTGAESNLAELAVVTFNTKLAGKFSFNVSIDYTANTSVIPTVISMQSRSLSGQIQIQISDSSQMSKREAPLSYDYDYYDEWLPYEYTRLRSKREACNNTPSAMDANGDCVVDLRDVYVLQEFLASEVYNFTTPEGQQLAQNDITVANIGEPSISQIFTIERNSLDLSFTVSGVFYTFFLQENAAPCQFLINGTVEPSNTALEFMDIVDIVQIYLDFSHDNASFQDEFNSTFGEDIIARKNGVNGQYGGTIMAKLSRERGKTIFMTQANSTFETEEFTFTVFLSVQASLQENINQLTSSIDLGSLSIQRVNTTTVSGVTESCIPTTEAPTTTEVLTTTEAPTTMAMTTMATTEAPTTMATTPAPTTIATTEGPSIMATTEFTTMATTVAPTILPTTEGPTIVATTELTIMATTELTSIATTESPTIIATINTVTTVLPTTTGASSFMATTVAPTTTEAPTVMATTNAPTTTTIAPTVISTTESPTIMATTVAATITTIVPTTTAIRVSPTTITTPTTIATIESSTIMATTESLMTIATTESSTTINIAATDAPTTMITTPTTMAITIAPTTTTIAPTTMATTEPPAIIATTVVPTTTATRVSPTIIATPTTIATTESSMTSATTEFSTTIAATDAPTTMITTDVPTTMATTIAPTTTIIAPESSTTIATTESSTTIATTDVPTTMAITVAPTTTTILPESSMTIATTDAPITMITTEVPTIMATTESTTTMATTQSTMIVVTTESPTIMATTTTTVTEALTTMTTTDSPTMAVSTAAPTITASAATPVTTDSTTMENTTAPTAVTSTAAPTTAASTATPVTTDSTIMENTTAPTAVTSTAAPTTAASTATPVTTDSTIMESTTAPTSTAAPTTAASTATPVTTDSTTMENTTAPTAVSSTAAPTTAASTATPVTTDSTITESTTAPTTMATEPSTVGAGTSSSGSDGTIIGIGTGLGLIAGILAIIVVVFIAVYAVKKHRKKGRYRPHSNHTTPSRGNKGYFFEEEERVELNPVNCDLVPMDSMNPGFFMESGAESMNLVPNHHIYHGDTNTGEDMIMSGSSMKPLIRDQPEPGRQAPIRGKQSYQYSESTLDHPPPPYHATGTTFTGTTLSNKSGNSTSPYDIEDDYFDLPFNDDPTQAYLSLGLTPQSQLSPADHTGSGSDGSYFFPSMPPPVMPSAFNSGIPVDSPFNISGSSGGGMVMPDAFPGSVVADHPRKGSGNRRSRHDHNHNPLSQGYPMKLPPVPEQSDPMEDAFSEPYGGGQRRRSRQEMFNGRGGDDSSSSSNDETSFMFPSADLDSSSSSQLHRQRGLRKKSGTRRVENGWSQSSQDGMVFLNKGAMMNHHEDVPERDIPMYELQGSPRHKGKHIRQQAKERELQRQKELLKQKAAEDERRRILQQEHRAAKIAKDYGSTRYREVDIDQQVYERSQGSGRVLQEAMKFEAQMQLMQEKVGESQSPGTNHNYDRMSQERRPQRQSSYGHIVNTYDQFTTI